MKKYQMGRQKIYIFTPIGLARVSLLYTKVTFAEIETILNIIILNYIWHKNTDKTWC
jgi:hypothetical protein